jgi:uncharacterized protein YndB with AHSA1/START domain
MQCPAIGVTISINIHMDEANPGFEVAFCGEYREIISNKRIAATDVLRACPMLRHRPRSRLLRTNGRTTLTLLVEHTSREHRDAHINSGMEDGMQESVDHLEQKVRGTRTMASGRLRHRPN